MDGISFVADLGGAREETLEGLVLLFHPASGVTHMLAPPAPQILDALKSPATLGELAARLAERFDIGEESGDAPAALASRVAELEQAGLVRRA